MTKEQLYCIGDAKLCASLSLPRSNVFISWNFNFNGSNITHLTGWLLTQQTFTQHLLSARHCLVLNKYTHLIFIITLWGKYYDEFRKDQSTKKLTKCSKVTQLTSNRGGI